MPYTFDSAEEYFTGDGKRMAKSHVRYWSNFAKNSQAGSSDKIEWNEYTVDRKGFLRFQKGANSFEENYIKSQCDFFDSIGYYY